MSGIHSRDKLIDALSQAAELEHLLCCSYLYAGFSLKKKPDDTLDEADTETTRKWATSIMLVARQEMEHLGMVCNLLSAVGAGANFSRPNFPQGKHYFPIDNSLELLPFSLPALDKFIDYEKPEWPTTEETAKLELDPLIPYTSLQGLYEYIRDGFKTLDAELGSETLFVGPTRAQITNETLFQQTGKAYAVNLNGILAKEPKDRLPEALDIIDQIITEGEGAINNTSGSHYARFVAIRDEYQAILANKPHFQPALPVVKNPHTFRHRTGGGGVEISDKLTLGVAQLFNLVYEAMMLLLIRFYGHTDETEAELTALQEIAFFPLMTMGIRPLGELLMTLPVSEEHPGAMAGPTFEITRPLQFLPHKQAAWTVLGELLTRTGSEAVRLAELADDSGSPAAERLHFIRKSLVRNAENFQNFIQGKENS